MRSLMDDDEFLQELEKIVTEPPGRGIAPAGREGFWAPEPRVTANERAPEPATEEPDLGSFYEPEPETAFEPDPVPALRERRLQLDLQPPFKPAPEPILEPLPIRRGFAVVTPAHVEPRAAASIVSPTEEAAGVPRLAAALLIVLCVGAGAGASAYVFRDRVSQIVTTWTVRSR